MGDYLQALDRDQLIALVTQEAAENPGLANALGVRAQLAGGGRFRVAAIEKLLVHATIVRSHLKAAETARRAREIDEAAHLIDLVVSSEASEAAIGLAEFALNRMSGLWSQVDDTRGLVLAANERFARLHLDACRAARPDPALLAQRLFGLEVLADSAPFARAAERYAEVLGPAGLEAYRKLLAPAWAKVLAVGPGASWQQRFSVGRPTITNAMAAMARATGDVDLEIDVESRDLRSPERFIAIATLCRDNGRTDEAVSWAERGIRSFDQETDALRDFVIEAYLASSRIEDAMRMAWERFTESPDAETFRALRRCGIKCGVWADWHDRAVVHVRQAAERAQAADGSLVPGIARTGAVLSAGSAFVAVLLADDRLEEALAAARAFGCAPAQWLELAGRCEAEQPDDAVAIYKARVRELLKQGDSWHSAAVDVLMKLRDLMAPLERTSEFEEYALDVRQSNARKWMFVSLFDRAALVSKQRTQQARFPSDPLGGPRLRAIRGGRR